MTGPQITPATADDVRAFWEDDHDVRWGGRAMSDRIDTGPIRERAQAAKTPGPYAVDNGWLMPFGHRVGLGGMWIEDAHHIAGLDPTTVLALCDEIDRLRETNDKLHKRAQIAEAAINELVTTTGKGKARKVAAEVWERCQESHQLVHQSDHAAFDQARAAIERVRALVSEARTWSPYETRDIGAAYLEETVTEQLNDIEQALDGDSDV